VSIRHKNKQVVLLGRVQSSIDIPLPVKLKMGSFWKRRRNGRGGKNTLYVALVQANPAESLFQMVLCGFIRKCDEYDGPWWLVVCITLLD
jgi:hypothetical protein